MTDQQIDAVLERLESLWRYFDESSRTVPRVSTRQAYEDAAQRLNMVRGSIHTRTLTPEYVDGFYAGFHRGPRGSMNNTEYNAGYDAGKAAKRRKK